MVCASLSIGARATSKHVAKMSEEESDSNSLPELSLSQDTMNQLLGAVGMSRGGGSTGNT